jgi:hypothetical protein
LIEFVIAGTEVYITHCIGEKGEER